MRGLRYVPVGICLWIAVACASVPSTASSARDCSASTDPNAVVDWCTRWRSVGYELHITRAPDWSQASSNPILQADWEAAAETDKRFVEDGSVVWDDSGPAIAFVWLDSAGPSFVWRAGQINVKGVRSEREIGAIVTFAKALNATVEGDDGETYGETGRPE